LLEKISERGTTQGAQTQLPHKHIHISHKFIGGWKKTTTFATNTRAREEQADHYFQEIIDIADNATPETVNVARCVWIAASSPSPASQRLGSVAPGRYFARGRGMSASRLKALFLVPSDREGCRGYVSIRSTH
jgi:hypothetical protein